MKYSEVYRRESSFLPHARAIDISEPRELSAGDQKTYFWIPAKVLAAAERDIVEIDLEWVDSESLYCPPPMIPISSYCRGHYTFCRIFSAHFFKFYMPVPSSQYWTILYNLSAAERQFESMCAVIACRSINFQYQVVNSV